MCKLLKDSTNPFY